MKYSFLILSFCLASVVSAQQQLTLEQCIAIALENNRNVKQQVLNKQNREIAYNQARADLLPNLNASAGQNFVFGRSIGLDNTYQNTNSSQTSFSLGSDITLFDGLRMKHNIDARRADVNASQADLDKIRDDIVISVSTAFLQVLLNKELLQISEDQIELTNANIAQRSELIKNGKMAEGEIYELEAQKAKEELNRVQAESNLKLALLDLAQIMEIENVSDLDITAPPAEKLIGESVLLSSDVVYQNALINRPEISGANFRLESAQKEVLMSKAQLYPTLSFGANVGTGYYHMSNRTNDSFSSQMRNNMSNSVGFSLRIPIFNRFQVRNSIRTAQIAVENSRLEMDKTKLDLRKRIEQAYYNALGANSRWEAAKKSEIAGREAYRFAEQKFENGRANSYELFQAKNNLTQVLGEMAQAKYEYAFRLKILELLKD
ncbi:MAG: TolC family protein [Dysgonomonadaceae bacterium]|nr:TolC family protein [Dysgonamonadaceae bacterium]HOT64001.1 TolC family protein [Dysgonamonadaceae bacterium]HOV35650.1 TolC family protein [Dysgonamonadaceae bacterium]HQG07210.1 TolC family protein [Dysgonamonadaceae bacterium]HQI42710.1 TolC family protein [Dysgonamonadaceae bacterium]